MFQLSQGPRLRRSPYFEATVAEGVTGFAPYNRMMLPTGYGDPEGEYWRLLEGVSMWDVAAERQVEIAGPDAARLAQILTPRALAACTVGQARYVALCDHAGTIINDPLLLKRDAGRYWFSIADSNVLLWARAVAAERGLQVEIVEPDVSPMAVQGPRAEAVVASVFGDWIRRLKLLQYRQTEIEGIPLVLARSGWSRQGGFELFLEDGAKGTALWNIVREAGRPWNIGPGAPNACERIEGGLLSWGADTDERTNPFEIRMGRFVDLDVADDVVGIRALRAIRDRGPERQQLGVVLDGETPAPTHTVWYDIQAAGRTVGAMTNGTWSYRLKRNIGFALVSRDCAPGDRITVLKDGEQVTGLLQRLPFL